MFSFFLNVGANALAGILTWLIIQALDWFFGRRHH